MKQSESENIKKIGTITLYNMEYLDTVAEKLLSYYALRKILSMKYILNTESVSNWVNVVDKNSNIATTLIEQRGYRPDRRIYRNGNVPRIFSSCYGKLLRRN